MYDIRKILRRKTKWCVVTLVQREGHNQEKQGCRRAKDLWTAHAPFRCSQR
jgi:hypothetical protein